MGSYYKSCGKCGLIKPLSEFYKRWCRKSHRSECKQCCRRYRKIWRKNNPESCAKSSKKFYRDSKEKTEEQRAIDKVIKSQKLLVNRKNKLLKYFIERYNNDVEFNISIKLRRRVSMAIRRQYGNKAYKVIELLGCSYIEFEKYFNDKFTKGMTWDKFMRGEIHIDHIKPCASFNLINPSQQKLCFHYSNLQPLWARDNHRKSNKIFT